MNRLWCITVILVGLVFQVSAQHRKSDGVDNVLEMVPYTSIFALKACGVEAQDNWTRLSATTVASWVLSAGTCFLLKNTIRETRPDGSNQKSFPSAHTSITFTGATILHKEYGHISPWISVAGYGIATFVGIDRVLRDRHYWYDVIAGAGIGILTAETTWWLSRKVLKTHNSDVMVGFSGNTIDVAVAF